jgi:hypothetical protein
MTPTPTATLPPLNFTLTQRCDIPGFSPYVELSNFTGGSTGLVYPGLISYSTQEEALASTSFSTFAKGSSDTYSYNQSGGFTIGQTYWFVVQDTGIPSRIIAKSIVIVSCP